jgi:tetratricopeptide (TPR) repeat protein
MVRSCDDPGKWPAVVGALRDRSPLVRASAAMALEGHRSPEAVRALLEATGDEFRLVRIRAAAALAGVPGAEEATAEYVTALRSRPDDPTAHFNLGNFHLDRGDLEQAVASYETALRIEPRDLKARVNVATALAGLGRTAEAEAALRQAVGIDPGSAAAHFNLGLLLAETGRPEEAEAAFRASLKSDPGSARAAYNLAVHLTPDRIEEAVMWYRRAATLRPEESKYALALAQALEIRRGDGEER